MWIVEFENMKQEYDDFWEKWNFILVWDLATHRIYTSKHKALQALNKQQEQYPSLKFRVKELCYVENSKQG